MVLWMISPVTEQTRFSFFTRKDKRATIQPSAEVSIRGQMTSHSSTPIYQTKMMSNILTTFSMPTLASISINSNHISSLYCDVGVSVSTISHTIKRLGLSRKQVAKPQRGMKRLPTAISHVHWLAYQCMKASIMDEGCEGREGATCRLGRRFHSWCERYTNM